MPGETLEAIDRQFSEWMDALVCRYPALFASAPRVEHPIRWLPGSAIDRTHPLVEALAASAAAMLGVSPAVEGIEGPCDMFAFHEFGVPAVLWGPRGGNTHNPDEYVEIDSLVDAASVLLGFVCDWCGVAA
jgi:acetylornithine deacetylase/succinyl-diaminopimelate desuccinylase-like protein